MTIYILDWFERAIDHIARHGVTPEEVEQALERAHYTRLSRGYTMVVGQTLGGRYLTVFLHYRPKSGTWYPVTARDSNEPEKRQAKRKAKGR